MTEPNAESNPPSAAPPPPASPKPAARPPIQVGNRRHFTSRSGGIPWKDQGAAPASNPPAPVESAAEAPAPVAPQPASTAPDAAPAPPSATSVEGSGTAPAAVAATPTPSQEAGPTAIAARPAEGQRRDKGDRRQRPGAGKDKSRQPAAPAVRDVPPSVVPKPSRRDQLTPDLEQEFAEALGGASIDRMMTGGYDLKADRELLELDSRRAASVVRLHGDDVFFALGGRNEGVVSLRQFAKPPQIGESYDVVVRGFNADDGLYELVVPGASIDVSDWSDLSEGAVVDAVVTAANTGGLECLVNKIRGFIPASQVSLYRVENLGEFVGQRIMCVVTEANAQRRNLVLSRRAMLEREKEEARKNFYANLEIGQVHEGVVRKIEDFGAFVDLNGADGLIHISQLSWERVKHPSEVLQEGQKVRVRIEKVDPQTGKIGLSLRSLQDHPWEGIESRFPVGAVVKGTVSRLANFGAFVRLAMGVEGLIHVSELAHYKVRSPSNVVKEGQEVEVKVLSVDPEAQRIGLSLKATLAPPTPEPEAAEGKAEADEPPRKSAVPKWSGPLKGGVDRPTGGEDLGLNW